MCSQGRLREKIHLTYLSCGEGKNPPAKERDVGDMGSIPGSGSSPEEGNGNPLQYSCLENPMGRGACRLQFMGSLRVGHNWSHTYLLFHFFSRNKRWLVLFRWKFLWYSWRTFSLLINSTEMKSVFWAQTFCTRWKDGNHVKVIRRNVWRKNTFF